MSIGLIVYELGSKHRCLLQLEEKVLNQKISSTEENIEDVEKADHCCKGWSYSKILHQ
jgi:hypothetical protein